MKVSGFTIIRNAIKFDYPIVEAITSILPLCDEFIVLVAESEDDTYALINQIDSPKIKIVHSIWNDQLTKGGEVLAAETNKAFGYISKESDWAFYIQADEVIHEKYLPSIKDGMQKWLDNPEVDGLLFNFKHFYGTYDYYGDSRKWYRKEIRIIKNHPQIKSYRDAQGFRKNGKKLNVKAIDAWIYHYGWVKSPDIQLAKIKNSQNYWQSDQWGPEVQQSNQYNYSTEAYLKKFNNTHPYVMAARLEKQHWSFQYNAQEMKASFRFRILNFLERLSGWRIGEYKNYRII